MGFAYMFVFAGLILYVLLLFCCFRLFSAGSVEEIMENLKKDGSAFALKQTEVGSGMVTRYTVLHKRHVHTVQNRKY